MVVGDNDVFAHHGLNGANLGSVFSKAHRPIFESKPVTFTADIELIAELAVSPGNGCGALPVAFPVVVLSAIFDQLGPETFKLAGVIVELPAHGGGIKRYHHRAFTPPQNLSRAEGAKPIGFFTRS